MNQADSNLRLARRRLVLRDSITFLALFSIVLVLFGVTSFLFRSFENRQSDLARTWSTLGQNELQEGKPAEAVTSLRAALSYAPDNGAYQLLLARALASAGRTDEAINYFLNLWALRPGDGFVNLQLARLMRRNGQAQQAIEYYRASIFGTWQGDGDIRRHDVRLELADYLIERRDFPAARTELLIAAGNAPDTAPLDLALGNRFQSAGDRITALTYYQKALADNPNDRTALELGGRAAYALGEYSTAHTLLTKALRQSKSATPSEALPEDLVSMADTSQKLMDLTLSRDLPSDQRIQHLLIASGVVKARLNSCVSRLSSAAPANSVSSPLQGLKSAGKSLSVLANRATLAQNSDNRDNLAKLIYNIELQTQQLCGPPTGNDALLLLLTNSREGSPHPSGQGLVP